MKKLLLHSLYLTLFLFLSCSESNPDGKRDEEIGIDPVTIGINTRQPYVINPATGDTARYSISPGGDTIATGKYFSFSEKVIFADSVAKPQEMPAGDPLVEKLVPDYRFTGQPAITNLHGVPGKAIPQPDKVISAYNDSLSSNTWFKIAKSGKSCVEPVPMQIKSVGIKDAVKNHLQYLSAEHGLSSDFVNCVYQDKRGFIWIGTFDNGANKYDGNTISVYNSKRGLNDGINAIKEDKKGNMFFACQQGLVEYDGNNFIHYLSGFNSPIPAIEFDRDENLWVGTTHGLYKCNGETAIQFTTREGLPSGKINALVCDKNGILWIATEKGLCSYDGNVFSTYAVPYAAENGISSLALDNQNRIWFGVGYGDLCCFDGKNLNAYSSANGFISNVRRILSDSQGNLLFGGWDSGVMIFDGRDILSISSRDGLSGNSISSLFEDNSGNIWIATLGGGVNIYRPGSFNYVREVPADDWVCSIKNSNDSSYWMGCFDKGLLHYSKGQILRYTKENGLLTSKFTITSIAEGHDGSIWYATLIGAGRFFPPGKNGKGKFRLYTKEQGLPHDDIKKIYWDGNNVWFGTKSGICRYDGQNFYQYSAPNLPAISIADIYKDNDGNLWFSAENTGIYKMNSNDRKIICYGEREGLPARNSFFGEDSQGNLWMLFHKGISTFSGESYRYYPFPESTMPKSFRLDKQDRIWLTTSEGLSCLSFDKTGNKSMHMHHYSRNDGIIGRVFFVKAAEINNSEALWGSAKGVVRINLDKFRLNSAVSKPYLTSIAVNGKFMDFRKRTDSLSAKIKYDSLVRFFNQPVTLTLPFSDNHLTFNFAALDWQQPFKIKYSYKMNGVDDKWSQISSETKADYHGLSYGTFKLDVRAVNESGIWSEPFEYTFTINPPWWHTWWARTVFAGSFILLLWQLYRWRAARLIKKQKELEHEIEVATHEIKKQKELIVEKHREITDSINYAERIQRSFMATRELLDANLKDYFVLFKPKDVVSGDFFWGAKLADNNFALVTADSTGHGVPGAIMSLLNITALEKAAEQLTRPSQILDHTRSIIIERLKKDGSADGGKDGMDCSLCVYNFGTGKLVVSAAHNPVWIVRDGGVTEVKADKMPVGKHDKDNVPFSQHEIQLQKGDVVYTITDGFPDQFGGPRGKKFMSKNLKELLVANAHLPMHQQKELLEATFAGWCEGLEQVDDVTVIGIRV